MRALASLVQAWRHWVRAQLPGLKHVRGHLRTGPLAPKRSCSEGRRAQVGTWRASRRGRPAPRGSFRVGSGRAGGGGPRRGAGRGRERAPPPRARLPPALPSLRWEPGSARRGRQAARAGGRGRRAGGGDGEGPRAEGAGRSMGGPRAWALLCLGLLLPGGSAAWSVGGAPFSGRR